jgi:hypothetical protein
MSSPACCGVILKYAAAFPADLVRTDWYFVRQQLSVEQNIAADVIRLGYAIVAG